MKHIKVADDIHKAIKIQSAETGKSVEKIADDLLRKEVKK